MVHNSDAKTGRKLLSMRPATRLTCVWLPSNDPRSPFTCVWQHARTTKPASLSSPTEERAHAGAISQGGQRCA